VIYGGYAATTEKSVREVPCYGRYPSFEADARLIPEHFREFAGSRENVSRENRVAFRTTPRGSRIER
jgi:hypothetical protein